MLPTSYFLPPERRAADQLINLAKVPDEAREFVDVGDLRFASPGESAAL